MKSERFTQHNRGELEKCVRNRWKERKDRVRERDRDRQRQRAREREIDGKREVCEKKIDLKNGYSSYHLIGL